jgi:predicted MFS family arabinose efflux permease
VEDRRGRAGIRPLLRSDLLRVPAFGVGLTVQLLFSVGLQGFFLTFALWLQTGQRFSPLHAGITLIAFSVGSFIGAPLSDPLARRYGRVVLAAGGVLLVLGTAGVAVAARGVGADANAWPIVPGLVVAGLGLAFLVIPLVNVVLAAAPVDAAGGASSLFSTAQQLGGAIGVALVGTAFFNVLASHSFLDAFTTTAPLPMAAFAACAVLSLLLPGHALAEEHEEAEPVREEVRAG